MRIDGNDATSRRETADQLAAATGADCVTTIGKTSTLYRPREGKPAIKLP